MCGIIGYVGSRDVVPVLIGGLKKLEYRGYDSAGIAVVDGNGVEVVRAEGKLSNLEAKLPDKPLKGSFGMGHTRWATHGKPNENNAHPHRDCTGKVVVIHNGIIENFLPLKQRLQKAGHEFKTETDTEVVAHLIEENLKGGTNFVEATKAALKELEGHYALVIIDGSEPGTIIAAKHGPPLVIGLGENENIVASDVAPLLSYTRNIIYLEDGEYAVADQIGSSPRSTARRWSSALARTRTSSPRTSRRCCRTRATSSTSRTASTPWPIRSDHRREARPAAGHRPWREREHRRLGRRAAVVVHAQHHLPRGRRVRRGRSDRIIAAKHGPPLVIGLGENENIVASDVAPLLSYTRNIIYLEDGEYAVADQIGSSPRSTARRWSSALARTRTSSPRTSRRCCRTRATSSTSRTASTPWPISR